MGHSVGRLRRAIGKSLECWRVACIRRSCDSFKDVFHAIAPLIG
jgi:hypothetical protein